MDELISLVSVAYNRFTTNVQGTFANMSPEKWIRLVIIAGACEQASNPAPAMMHHLTSGAVTQTCSSGRT